MIYVPLRYFGIDETRAVSYHSDHQGTRLAYEVISDAVCDVRAARPLGRGWKKRIVEDFKNRK